MKKGVAALFVMVVMAAAVVHDAAAVECNPIQLVPCLGAISPGQNPSPQCCAKLKEQQPCFCQYIRNPQFKPYVDSPNAKKVAAFCGIKPPTC
ncbi:non-specific lipid-transfer protein 2-like [Salvia divinorum]|uniref:Non-specific lipid-transfer protein 2-like n=1 Tax=Salvia divinorum TaxID=28513 RepID=A0ABD1HI65_SALDI